jgi:hypothetical protein
MGINIPTSVINYLIRGRHYRFADLFTVLLGELIPKRLAMKKAEQIALGMSGLIYAVSKLFTLLFGSSRFPPMDCCDCLASIQTARKTRTLKKKSV